MTTHRFTKTEARASFTLLAKLLGRPILAPWIRSGPIVWHASKRVSLAPGATIWVLDYSQPHGGFLVLERVLGEQPTAPLGPKRRSAREFSDSVTFAANAILLVVS